ncbi:MAG: hypothetical protein ACYDB3_07420, partial [Acidimicrobiales bacterium]
MSAMARLLTIMGSGETAPTMVKTHRAVVERLGPQPVHGLMLDTPFGFQTNAPEIAARAVAYFRDSVGAVLEVAGMRSTADLDGPGGDALVARLAAAPFVFAGPGSPTYALRQWRGTLVPSLLGEKLALGGAVTFASAAALTLGSVTVPVYEVYKVGEEPRWVDGLDLLGALGLPVALIPHYDNAEGGTHDTRFCYLGEQRLAALEATLPAGAFVLGVDEHTALGIDLDAGTAAVTGRGGVTVRVGGRSARIEAGQTVTLSRLTDLAGELASGRDASSPGEPAAAYSAGPGGAGNAPATGDLARSPLLEAVRRHEEDFRTAREESDPRRMVAATLALEEELWAWRADTLQSDEADRGRAAVRAMVAELGALAEHGARDPAELLGPYVDLALEL